MKKMVQIMVVALMAVSLVVGASWAAEKPDTSKKVALKMYLVGDGAPEADQIWAEVNKMLEKDINATVEVTYIPWSGAAEKGRLLLSSGEDFDIIFAANWFLFQEQVQLGAYYPLDELLPVYGQGLLQGIPKEAWAIASYQGQIMMVPYNSYEFDTHGVLYRVDLAKKYGLPDGQVKTIDDLEVYLEKAKEDLKVPPMNVGREGDYIDYEPWRVEAGMRQVPMMEVARDTGLWYYVDEPEKLFTKEETEGYKNWIVRAKRWADKGFWSRDALAKDVKSRNEFVNGNSASCWVNPLQANDVQKQMVSALPGTEYGWWNPKWQYPMMVRRSFIGNGIAINANAKNPARALMLIDLLHNDQRYNELTTFGIKGKHWDEDAQGFIRMPEGVKAADSGYPWDRACPWGWREDKFYRLSPLKASPEAMWPVVSDLYKKWAQNATVSVSDGFIFDRTPVEGEMTALLELGKTYGVPLSYGLVDDPMKGYAEYQEKSKQAGREKVRAEVEKQWQAFLATLKK